MMDFLNEWAHPFLGAVYVSLGVTWLAHKAWDRWMPRDPE